MPFHGAVDNGQPQPGAFPVLGSEEGLEDLGAHLRGHPDTGVADLHRDRLGRDGPLQANGPAGGHGVHGIEQQVDEGLPKLRGLPKDRRQVVECQVDRNAPPAPPGFIFPPRPRELQHLSDEGGEVTGLERVCPFGTGKVQEPLHHGRAVGRRRLDESQRLLEVRGRMRELGQFGLPQDRRQGIVQVVRDSCRHLA